MQRIWIEKSTYLDSVSLMRISRKASEADGVKDAVAAMATDTNLLLMKEAGFDLSTLPATTADDLLIAIDAASDAAAEAALGVIREEMKGGTAYDAGEAAAPPTPDTALVQNPDINLVLISVPGKYAAYEAHKAVAAGKHVMVFSDNVSIEDEKHLKTLAAAQGLLFMGPDCGTAIVNGVGLGFANKVPRGGIGIVSASGTGAQEVSSILARHGVGISQLIGTGGRDLSPAVGGLTTLAGLKALAADAETHVIVLISKVPDRGVGDKLLKEAGASGKPCVVYFAGAASRDREQNLIFTSTLSATAVEAARAAGCGWEPPEPDPVIEQAVRARVKSRASTRRYLRGLFSGGTLAQEAFYLLQDRLGEPWSNMKIPGARVLEDAARSREHTLIDVGDDIFTRGRPHPMIDQSYRLTRLAKEMADHETAVILLDVVLGFGCNADPGGEIARELEKIRGGGPDGDFPFIVTSICGTYEDPQGYRRQRDALRSAGIVVAETNQDACRLARSALEDT